MARKTTIAAVIAGMESAATAGNSALEMHAHSATLTSKAVLIDGVSANSIAQAARKRLATAPELRGALFYTSPASVIVHARTGLILSLEGDLGEQTIKVEGEEIQVPITSLDLQRWIFKIDAKAFATVVAAFGDGRGTAAQAADLLCRLYVKATTRQAKTSGTTKTSKTTTKTTTTPDSGPGDVPKVGAPEVAPEVTAAEDEAAEVAARAEAKRREDEAAQAAMTVADKIRALTDGLTLADVTMIGAHVADVIGLAVRKRDEIRPDVAIQVQSLAVVFAELAGSEVVAAAARKSAPQPRKPRNRRAA